ncbi:nucleotidyltransferase family protein [Thioclava sp. F42-5]|uniref:nucleotidyltransferase domain-containing protein n=1 Tax=Thioclava sp. F42-5 TaxID=1973005 RepID=UPI00143D1032|nr:nucleotidyltransferase family protein [Thioclava sp. F42-5]
MDQLKDLLLDLLFAPADRPSAKEVSLTEGEAEIVLTRAQEHRVGPLLMHAVQARGDDVLFPTTLSEPLRRMRTNATFRTLAMQSMILDAHRILNAAGIPHLFLKGAFLSLYCYPEAGLRPMRDLDIFVPMEQALEAYEVMIRAGFMRHPKYPGIPSAFLESDHHLPPLRAGDGRGIVEIHFRLTYTRAMSAGHQATFQQLFDRAIIRSFQSETLMFPGLEDFLLHLCVHAAYHHNFDNGPLGVADIQWLLASSAIDWPFFWKLAEDEDAIAGAALCLRLAETLCGDMGVEWNCEAREAVDAAPDVVRHAARSLLQDFHSRGDAKLRVVLSTTSPLSGRIRELQARIFPSRGHLAKLYPFKPGSPMLWLCYPAHWKRIFSQRLPSMLRSRMSRTATRDVESLRAIANFLSEGRKHPAGSPLHTEAGGER